MFNKFFELAFICIISAIPLFVIVGMVQSVLGQLRQRRADRKMAEFRKRLGHDHGWI